MTPPYSQKLDLLQKQILNQEMKLSLDMLAMDICELREMLLEATVSNPFLDLDFIHQNVTDAEQLIPVCHMETAYHNERDTEQPKFVLDTLDEFCHRGSQDHYNPVDNVSHEQTFSEMLEEQIRTLQLENQLSLLCIHLVHSLDCRGYLDTACGEIADNQRVTLAEVRRALRIVQSLYPTGVGAQTLKECLILQLKDRNLLSENTKRLVKHGLPLLAKSDLPGIAALLNCSVSSAVEASRIVQSLNPIPSRGFKTDNEPIYVVPDVSVRYENGAFIIAANDQVLPRVTLNSDCCALVNECTEDEITELRRYLPLAKAIIRGVNSRRSTLLNVLQCVILKQSAFFRYGSGLRPMEMQSIADALEIHVSTVSRAIKNKYIDCAKGTVSLRSLFERSYSKSKDANGTESVSHIKQQLIEIIESEAQAKPLSDMVISNKLCAQGYVISRRTIAKFRDEMGIPCASQRRAAYGVYGRSSWWSK